jgi:hypothetical protein
MEEAKEKQVTALTEENKQEALKKKKPKRTKKEAGQE